MSSTKAGPRELSLRAMREQQAAEAKAEGKKKKDDGVCRIDHDGPDATIPRELCRICNPQLSAKQVKAMFAAQDTARDQEKARDFDKPKGMADDEWATVKERRASERKAKAQQRIEALKKAKAEKEAAIVAKANEKRQEQGLPPIEAKVTNTGKDETMPKKPKAKAKVKAKKVNGDGARKGSKSAKIEGLLLRPDGCTSKEVLKATGWPTISMPAIAKSLGLKLRKEKTDTGMRYYGSR